MKFKMLVATATLAGLAMLTPNLASAGQQDFTLHNDTGYTIKEVYVSLTRVNDWQEDVLGQDTLDDEDSVHINFPPRSGGCSFDIKVVYMNDASAYWKNLDLCSISDVTVHYNSQRGNWATWE